MNNAGGIKDMDIEEWNQDDIRFQIWDDGGTLDQVSQAVKELGWEAGDEIIVKIAGSRISGIHQTETANAKWAPPYGDVRHNRDAQIVIENISRRDLSKSKPMDEVELSKRFLLNSSGQLCKAREQEPLPEPSPMVVARPHPWTQIINWLRTTLSK